MSNSTQQIAQEVLEHILTKGDSLNGADKRVMQQALVDLGIASFTPNGTFGPGTTGALVEFLSKEENAELVRNLSSEIRDELSRNDVSQSELNTLNDHSVERDATIKEILSKPYLARGDLPSLQEALGFEKTDYYAGNQMREALKDHLRSNQGLVIENMELVQKLKSDPQRLNENSKPDDLEQQVDKMVSGQIGYALQVKDLISQKTDGVSPVNFKLQSMLIAGGYLGGEPDGGVGEQTMKAIERFERDIEGKTLKLSDVSKEVFAKPPELSNDVSPQVS